MHASCSTKKIKPCAAIPYPEVLPIEALLVCVWAIQWNLWRHVKKIQKVAATFSHMAT